MSKANNYDTKFTEFDKKFPEVRKALTSMARQTKAAGFAHYSMKTLYCVLRHEINLSPTPKPYKLNDIYHSRYARLIMDTNADLQGFFELRELRS
jgi:hypothetical protein